MTDNTLNKPASTFTVQKYKVSGFDLIITTPDGDSEVIKEGLPRLILGTIELKDTSGKVITQNDVISTIKGDTLGLDTVYLGEKLEGNEYNTNTGDNEAKEPNPGDNEIQQQVLQEKIKEYEELLKKNAETLKKKELQEAKQQETENKEIVDKKLDQQLSKTLKPAQIEVQNTVSAKTGEESSSSSSSSSSSPVNNITPPPKTSDAEKLLFISGKLDAESDSGKRGDAITNCVTPSFSGFATPDANAVLILNEKMFPITSDSEGKWTLKVDTPLTDGIYDVTFRISDLNGKSVESKITLTIDTSLDGLSAGLDKDSDSGVIGDDITNNSQPIINGKTEPGAIVTVEINDTILKTIANVDGFWSVVPPQSLTDGVYKYSVTATDAAGNTATIDKELTIDTELPDATIFLSSASDSGVKGDFITNVSLPTLSGKTDSGVTVQLTFDRHTYTITSDINGNWFFTPPAPLNDGIYSFTAQVTDLAGNTASHAGNLTIDSQIPTVSANLAQFSDSGLSDHDNITNNEHPELTGVTKANATVSITLGGQHYSVVADKEGNWSWSVPDSVTLNQGLNSYAISVTDTAGNTTKEPFAGSFILDTIPPSTPTIGLNSESNSGDKNDSITNVNKPVFVGQSEPFSQVTVIVDNHTYSVRADMTGAWRLDLQEELHDGTYDVEIYATDLAGNVSIDKTIWTFEIDTSIPTLTTRIEETDDTGVSDSDGITQNKQPTFTGVTTANASITLNIDGNEYHTVADNNGLWWISLPVELQDNSYNYTVSVVNKAGTSAITTGTVVIDTTPPSSDASLSEISDSGRSHSDNITNVTKPTLTGTTEPNSIIEVQFDGNSYSPTVSADGEWLLTLPDKLMDGNYTYTVVATDVAGNTSSSLHHFVIDTISELTSGLDISSVMEGASTDTITNLARPMLSGMAEPGSIVTVYIAGNKYIASVEDTGHWTFTLPKDAVAGINNYSVTSEDLAGNKTTLSGNFTYISSGVLPPKVTVQLAPDSDGGVIGDAMTNHSTPTFIGNATPGCSIVLVINGHSYSTTASAIDGSWSIDVLNTLREGYSDYTVTATDPSTSLSTTISSGIYIDTINPEITINLTDDTDTGIKGDMITQNRNPIFKGKTEAGAKVLLYIDGEEIYTVADADGNWTLMSSKEFPPNHQTGYTVTVTDLAGNETSQSGTLVIDNTAPFLSSSRLDSTSDTGERDHYWTNQLTPTLTGKTEPGCKLTININGTIYDVTDIANDGTWKFTVPPGVVPSNTPYYTIRFWVTATDAAGNSTTTTDAVYSARYQLDLTGTLSNDTDTDVKGDNLTSNKTPTLEGTITGEGKDLRLVGTIEINGKTYPIKINDNQTKWSFSIPDSDALASGTYDYTLKLVDKFGEENTFKSSITISHLVGHLAPEDDTGTVGNNQTTNTSPSLTGQSIAGAIIRIEINGETHTVPVNNDGTWTFQVPNAPLSEGVYNYKVTEIFDGKTTTYSNSFTIDLTPPDITAGLSSSTRTPNDATVTQSDKPILEGMTSPNQEVIILIGDKRFSTMSSANGSWSIELKDLNLGDGNSYSYTVISSDGAGNTGKFTGSFSTHLYRPSATAGTYQEGVENIEEGKTNSIYMNKVPPTLMGKGTPGDTIELFNAKNEKYTTTVNDDGTWYIKMEADVFNATTPQGGYYSWKLKVIDSYGVSVSYNTRLIYDSVAPILTATLDSSSDTGVANDGITCKKQPMLSGTTDANQNITILLNGKDYTITADNTGKWSFTVPEKLQDGMYDYTVKAIDKAGNNTTVSGSFTVNTTPVSVDGYVDTSTDSNMNNGWSNINHQTLKGTSTPSSTVVITINGKDYYPVVLGNGDWILELTDLPNGSYNYVITASNNAGNQSSVTGAFHIDDTTPSTTVNLSSETDSGFLGDFITNNQNPVFYGKTKPNATVTLIINGENYTATADSTGNWTIPVSQNLVSGMYNYTVNVVDLAQNSSIPFNGNLQIETTLPTGTITVELDPDSDSGTKGDGITNNQKPNMTGSAPASSIVVVVIGGHTYKTVASTTGTWKLAITNPLSEGTHSYDVYIEDVAGNQSDAVTGYVTIDCNAALDISGLSPTTDSGVKGDQTTNVAKPTITGAAEPGAAIQLIINGEIYKTTANADGQWSVTISGTLPDGSYSYSVSATDFAGNITTDNNVLIIDTTAPDQLTGALSAGSETGGIGSNVTNQQCPEFTGTTENGATVTLMLGGKSYTGIAGSDGQWKIVIPDSDSLSDGIYSYTITTQDASGNVSGLVISGNVTVKHTPPSAHADLQAGSDTGIIGNHMTSNTQPLLSGKTAVGATIVIVFAGVNYPVPVNAAGDWSFRIPTVLAQGDYNYQVIATDNAGNISTFNGEFSIDTTPPTAPNAALAESSDSGVLGDNLTNDNTPTFMGTSEAIATVALTINGKTYTTTAKSDGSWSITVPASDTLPDNTYEYTVTASDGAGNISNPVKGTVTIDTTPPASLTGELASDSDSGVTGDNITNVTEPTFTGQTEADATVKLSINGKTYTTTAKSDGSWSITVPASDTLPDNTYEYTVTASDGAGNISNPVKGTVTIDTTPPASLTGELASDSDSGVTGDNITNVTEPTFTGQTEADATVKLSINGKTYTTTAKSDGSWSITVPASDPLPDNTYEYTVTASDSAGNISELKGTVTIDTTPPASLTGELASDSDSGVTGDNITNVTEPTFTGTTESHAVIKMSINHHEYTTKADDAGNWSIKVTDSLENQTYNYTISSTDSAGNVKTITNSLIVDTLAPKEPVLTSGVDNTDSNTYTLYGKVEGDTGIQVKIEINNEAFTANVDNSTGSWSVNVPHDKIIAGENNYIITATDIAGNSTTHAGTFFGSSAGNSVPQQGSSISPTPNSVDEHLINEAVLPATTEDESHHYL